MNIAFRVDASTQIGTGHFMRCLTLANALQQQRGIRIRFICQHLPEYLCDILTAKNYELVLLGSEAKHLATDANSMKAGAIPSKIHGTATKLAHASWLGVSQALDASDSIQALADLHWDWIVVDHYALDERWESVLRQTARKILVIDDIADRHHDCDVLLDQNFYLDMNSRYVGKVPNHCQLLLGPRYALLRKEFQQVRPQVKPRKGVVKRVLIFFGGIDADNHTGRAIQALIDIGVSDINVDVVIGEQHPCREAIEAVCLSHNFTCHVQTDRMAELMSVADLSIGAGGSTTWERCCLGLPTITICTADNQRNQIADAASEGLVYAFDINYEFDLVIKCQVKSLIENTCLRQLISRNGMQRVDGRGVLRVIDNISLNCIDIRIAKQDDSERLLVWRNHPAIREVSRNADVINSDEHYRWFNALLNDPNKVLLIGQLHGVPVGVIRFDIHDDQAEISIYLVPDAKGSCRGRDLLQSAEMWFAQNYKGVNMLHAHVLGANERSHQLFLAVGYDVESIFYIKKLQ